LWRRVLFATCAQQVPIICSFATRTGVCFMCGRLFVLLCLSLLLDGSDACVAGRLPHMSLLICDFRQVHRLVRIRGVRQFSIGSCRPTAPPRMSVSHQVDLVNRLGRGECGGALSFCRGRHKLLTHGAGARFDALSLRHNDPIAVLFLREPLSVRTASSNDGSNRLCIQLYHAQRVHCELFDDV